MEKLQILRIRLGAGGMRGRGAKAWESWKSLTVVTITVLVDSSPIQLANVIGEHTLHNLLLEGRRYSTHSN